MLAKEIRVTQWGTSLGIRLPKEFSDLIGLKHKSLVKVELKDNMLQVMPIKTRRVHVPLSERMDKALADGLCSGKPAEITEEDKEWLDMPPIGNEVVAYD